MSRLFDPPVALASLSGQADAAWAGAGAPYAGAAFLGGIALDEPTREAARKMVGRDREEFLPADPVSFVDEQLSRLEGVSVRPGFNVRAVTTEPLRATAEICARRGAIIELNAHCRQSEMCAVGAGETLLEEGDRLCEQVRVASRQGATVSVKLRAEVEGVNLPAVAAAVDQAGADMVHVDAMDSESVIQLVDEATDTAVIANNGVRNEQTVREYFEYGADAVSVGRPSDNPELLSRVRAAATVEEGRQ